MRIAFLSALLVGISFAASAQSVSVTADPTTELNSYRVDHGLSEVREDGRLMTIAQRQADAMASTNTMSHVVGGRFGIRIAQAGLRRAGENLAYGYVDFSSTFDQWRTSRGHNANLLMNGARRWGYARSCSTRCYWAMVIGD
jgi:uncharacterized protein YkwD